MPASPSDEKGRKPFVNDDRSTDLVVVRADAPENVPAGLNTGVDFLQAKYVATSLLELLNLLNPLLVLDIPAEDSEESVK